MLKQVKKSIKRRVDGRVYARLNRTVQDLSGRLGAGLLPLFPDRVARLEGGDFSIYTSSRSPLDSVLRAGLAHRAMANGDLQALRRYHNQFWASSAGDRYHEDNRTVLQNVTLPHFSSLLKYVAELVALNHEIEGVCEVGCGNGEFLQHMAAELPSVKRLVGIDLSPETTAKNNDQNSDPRIEFVAADADDWIREHGQPNWLYVSHRGVLEYFPQPALQSLVGHIAERCTPNLMLVIEPVGIDFDFQTDLESRTYGREFSFSHNYGHILTNAGYRVLRTEEPAEYFDHKLCAVLAEVGQAVRLPATA